MNADLSNLADDALISKQDVVALATQYQEKIHYLEDRIRLLQNELFGRKSEKSYPEPDDRQLPIFGGTSAGQADADQLADDNIVIAAHKRKKRGRKPLPDHLPRVEIIHDLSDEEKICGCGKLKNCIGKEQCEKLDYTPAKIQVQRHIRLKYACKGCEGVEDDGPTVMIAPPPVALIPKSNATEGLLAHIVVSKFADGLPLYRQEKIFSRIGVDLSRATMANWMVKAARCCSPLVELLQNEIRSGPLINIDESPLQVLKEPGRKNTSKSYMWVFCGGRPEHPTVLYQYHPTRSGQAALKFLDDYMGYIQSDDFGGYDYLGNKKAIVHLGCWAHVRRKFFDVAKVRKKHRGKRGNPKGLADQALEYIRALYRIEKQIRQDQLTPDQIHQRRQELSKPILDQFKQWLDATEPLTPPKGLLGRAINYALKNWEKLIVYVADGLLRPDNNAAENAIRPFVVGRKNWLFAGHPNGAAASATFFSLIETAKANDLEPYAYLRCLFKQLPLVKEQDGYRKLLPQYIDPDLISAARA
jgi:transposase